MLSWLETKDEDEKERLVRENNIRTKILEISRNPLDLEKIEKIAASRTAGIWRIKRAKIILGTLKGKSIEKMVLEVRVPPESVLKCQVSFAEQGLKYFDHPSRKPTGRETTVEHMLAFLENPLSERSTHWKKINVRYIGHEFSAKKIQKIRSIILANANWNRNQIAYEVCRLFDFRQSNGKFKISQINQVLIRMAMDNLISLPLAVKAKKATINCVQTHIKRKTTEKTYRKRLLNSSSVETIQFIPALNKETLVLWRELIEKYHYIRTSKLFGAQMKYLVYGGRNIDSTIGILKGRSGRSSNDNWQNNYSNIARGGQLLAVIGFASSAWKLRSRDRFIGWDDNQRSANLRLIVNNARFLILPWIKLPNLASRILGGIAKQLPFDWEARYNYRPVLLETFVQTDRFRGTCYRAANWIHVGRTDGYSLYSKYRKKVSTKDVYVYPLYKDFRRKLCGKIGPC